MVKPAERDEGRVLIVLRASTQVALMARRKAPRIEVVNAMRQ